MPHSSSSALHGVNLNFKKNSTIINFDSPPNNKKNQNSEKMKKTSGDVIILHM